MAKRRVLAVSLPTMIPTPLTSLEDPFWKSPGQVALLYEDIGVEAPEYVGFYPFEAAPGWARFTAFRSLFCDIAGLSHPQYKGMDYARAKAAGIDVAGTARHRIGDLPATVLGPAEAVEVRAVESVRDELVWDGTVPLVSYPASIWAQYATYHGVDVTGMFKARIIFAVADHFKVNREGRNPAEVAHALREADTNQ